MEIFGEVFFGGGGGGSSPPVDRTLLQYVHMNRVFFEALGSSLRMKSFKSGHTLLSSVLKVILEPCLRQKSILQCSIVSLARELTLP